MSYRNFKRSLREEIVKKSQKQIKKIEGFKKYIYRLCTDQFSQEKLLDINEIYQLGLEEVNSKTVREALEKLIKSIENDLKESGMMLKSIDSDFNTRVGNLPMFISSLLSTSDSEAIHYIHQIFMKQIMADKKDSFDIVSYEGSDFSKLNDYEAKLKELINAGKIDEFNQVAREYFDYFLAIPEIKKVLESSNISIVDIKAWFKGMLEIEDLEPIELPSFLVSDAKSIIKKLRERLEGSLTDAKAAYKELGKVNVSNKWELLHFSIRYKNICGMEVNNLDNYDFLAGVIEEFMEIASAEIEKLKDLESAITNKGISKPVQSLPRLIFECFQLTESPVIFGFLVVSGIKYAGMVKRPIDDKVEGILHPLEVSMASFIQKDFSVKDNDKAEFLRLFKLYLYKYMDNCECVYGDYPLKYKIPFVLQQVDDYLDQLDIYRAIIKEEERLASEKAVKPQLEVSMPTQEESKIDVYLRNYQETGIGTLEEFEKLLVSEGLDEEASNEYLTQMMNAMDEYEKNKLRNKRVQVLINNSLEDNITLYDMGLSSSYVDAKLLMNELNMILDLLENAREEEKDDLISTVWEYFAVLRDLVAPTYLKTKNGVNRNLIYFKDDSQVPYLFKAVSNLEDSLYAKDAMDKIMTENIYAVPSIEGDYPVNIKAMGKGFKIFYTVIGNNIIIINGSLKEISYEEVLSIVNSREFLEFMKGINLRIKNGFVPNEETFTNMIMEELNKPRGKK